MGEEGPRFTLGCPIHDGRNKMNDLDMTAEEPKKIWKDEEDCAFIKGWDFSHIHGRYEEERIVFRGITKKSSAASLRMK
jgi:hypothetical protein